MDPQAFYRQCLTHATEIIKQVQAGQLTNETPDDDWTVRELANHMLYEVSWVPDMVAGRTIAQVGGKYDGDLFDGDVANAQTNLHAAWDTTAEKAERAVSEGDMDATAHLSYADTTVGDYLMQTGGDVLVHAWDLAKAIGVSITFDGAVAETMWQGVKDVDLASSGLFKPPVPVADDASTQDKIIAHFGRNPHWQPTS